MYKTVTLRLKKDVYDVFLEMSQAQNRSLANLIETAALRNIIEQQFVDDVEMAEIRSNKELMQRINKGSMDARQRKGAFVE